MFAKIIKILFYGFKIIKLDCKQSLIEKYKTVYCVLKYIKTYCIKKQLNSYALKVLKHIGNFV